MMSGADSSPAMQEKLKVAFAEGYLASDKNKTDPESKWNTLPRRMLRFGLTLLTIYLMFQLLQTYSALGGSMLCVYLFSIGLRVVQKILSVLNASKHFPECCSWAMAVRWDLKWEYQTTFVS